MPDAEWLAFNLPTPPLNKILVEYLPKLKARCSFDGKVKPPPATVLERLKEGASIRNRVIHAGATIPSIDKIEEILGAVRELLWTLRGRGYSTEKLAQIARVTPRTIRRWLAIPALSESDDQP